MSKSELNILPNGRVLKREFLPAARRKDLVQSKVVITANHFEKPCAVCRKEIPKTERAIRHIFGGRPLSTRCLDCYLTGPSV